MEIVLQSIITCPHCGYSKMETMSMDKCQFFYTCDRCIEIVKPKAGDCCVFCSYSSVICPPMQDWKHGCEKSE